MTITIAKAKEIIATNLELKDARGRLEAVLTRNTPNALVRIATEAKNGSIYTYDLPEDVSLTVAHKAFKDYYTGRIESLTAKLKDMGVQLDAE